MNIFWRVYFAHLLCDFTLQTEQLVKWKREKAWGLSAHVLIFFLVGSFLTTGNLSRIWLTRIGLSLAGWMCLLTLSVIHFLLDNGRVQVITWRGSHADNLYFFLLDQAFHIISIYLLTPRGGPFEKWAIIGCLVVIATHFTNIFLYYSERLFNAPEKVKVYTPEKHYSLIERLLIVGCFLLPGQWWLIASLLGIMRPMAGKIFNLNPQGHNFSLWDFVFNYSFAVFCGILVRIVYHI